MEDATKKREHVSIFYDSDKSIMERKVDVSEWKKHSPNLSFEDFFDIDRTVTCIQSHNFKKVALQIPDELLQDSARLCSTLQKKTNSSVFILADTSYGACCVDEVAAEHVDAELIVHYGRSCMSRPSRHSVLYVFGRKEFSIEEFLQQLHKEFKKEDKVLVLFDVSYEHAMSKLEEVVHAEHFSNFIFSSVEKEFLLPSTSKAEPEKEEEEKCCTPTEQSCGDPDCCRKTSKVPQTPQIPNKDETFFGRKFTLLPGTTIQDYQILFIGQESITLTNFMLNLNQNKFVTYNPVTKVMRQETLNVSKSLMKRYFLIQKVKDVDVIGIVVGTLSAANYLNVIEYLKKCIREAGKRFYVFLVGKLNVAKLANFQEVEMFVLVACPENSLIDSKDFYRPIVTPFELEIALVRGKEWTGRYLTDFSRILPGLRPDEDNSTEESVPTEEDQEETRLSLLDGIVRVNHKKQSASNPREPNSLAVATRSPLELATIGIEEASKFLQSRSWQGLEQKIGETPVEKAVEGRSGIPMTYSHESERRKEDQDQ